MSEVRLRAFLDESRKPLRDGATGGVLPWGDHYVVGAVTCLEGSLDDSRIRLKQLRQDLGFDLHFSELGAARKRAVISGLLALDMWDGFIFESAAPAHRSTPDRRLRDRILRVAVGVLVNEASVEWITMESRSNPQGSRRTLDMRDHSTISGLMSRGVIPRDLILRHSTKREPMLWISDVIASCRSDYICGRDRATFPLLAHRIRGTHGVAL